MTRLTHFDETGMPRMVDVSGKAVTSREAIAAGSVLMSPETLQAIREGRNAKGDVLAVAQVAAIMGTKKTSDLIPMCHPLGIDGVTVDLTLADAPPRVEIQVTVRVEGRTGVEMEALTGVTAAALTIYDMCKAADRSMTLTDIRLISKTGGKSGTWTRASEPVAKAPGR